MAASISETKHMVEAEAAQDVFTTEKLRRLQHDVNNRLYRVSLNVDLLKMGSHMSSEEIFQEINQSIDDIRTLLKRSLSSSVTMKKEVNDLILCCRESLSPGFLNLLAEKNIKMSLQFPQAVMPKVWTDRVFLSFALENILMNAFHALEKVEGEKRIEIEIIHDDNWINIIFRDNGPGIDASQLEVLMSYYKKIIAGSPLNLPQDQQKGWGLLNVFKFVAMHDGHARINIRNGRPTGKYSISKHKKNPNRGAVVVLGFSNLVDLSPD